ncbi:aminotransferase DegT [Dyella flagellata]|uniref:Aminotransferase DegT n=2 Tax=Dyella flagellata TaxID=1867833 RepID=A0ABQ5XC43_9GAMM|nr:aminotransferase DegT [Dyella flagellata]
MNSTWISSKGEFIARFESGFANFVGAGHAASVCNGTVALHLALLVLGIGEGDEVIVPSLTYIASVNAIRYVGATPIFADSLPDTWQIDPADVERRITPRTKAVMAVHLYGGACDMTALSELCSRHDLRLVEDCAEAIGTLYNGRHVGTFGDVATFSFFGNKTITTGEGGMVVCKTAAMDHSIRHFRGQGLAGDREYWHDVIGYNYRMTNICAAIGTAQLERVNDILRQKKWLAQRYHEALIDVPIQFQALTAGESPSYWMVTILTPASTDRDELRKKLKSAGVETRPVFYPAHTMPMYAQGHRRFPVAEDIASRGINLPSWHQLSSEDIEGIADVIREFPWSIS